ncbi:hypothetical protein F750_6442 [Streptomyces sp. PAMC 26508]|nr:hypothetical protein F750_6442 [Streptomyces sp. PAMC 26508]
MGVPIVPHVVQRHRQGMSVPGYGSNGSRPADLMSAAAWSGSTGAFGAHHRHGPPPRLMYE